MTKPYNIANLAISNMYLYI